MSKSVPFFCEGRSIPRCSGPFLKKLPADHKWVVEIRNMNWQDARLAGVLRERNLAPALTDTSFVPRLWEMNGAIRPHQAPRST